MVIDGRRIAEEILARLKERPAPAKFMAGVLVGDDPASASFQKIKERTARSLGIDYRIMRFPAEMPAEDLRREIAAIAGKEECGGVILQLPLPGQDHQTVLGAIPPAKDPDVLGAKSIEASAGGPKVLQPAAAVVEEILRRTGFDLASARAAVVGRGFLIGGPVAAWLAPRAKSLESFGRGSDLSALASADLVILGAGQAGLISPSMLKEGAAVIDFGYAPGRDGKLLGDLDPKGAERLLWHTPTPGGTGPILVAKLFENFYLLNASE